MLKLRVALILCLLAGIAIVLALYPRLIGFSAFSSAYFVQQLTPLALVSLFIERALEVFLTAWRGKAADQLLQQVKHTRTLVAANQATLQAQHTAEDALAGYKSQTQRIALPAALLLGILVSALGVRGLELFVDQGAFAKLPQLQQKLFAAMDVLLTGSLLGGGSDFLHKFISTFTTFMDATAAKNR